MQSIKKLSHAVIFQAVPFSPSVSLWNYPSVKIFLFQRQTQQISTYGISLCSYLLLALITSVNYFAGLLPVDLLGRHKRHAFLLCAGYLCQKSVCKRKNWELKCYAFPTVMRCRIGDLIRTCLCQRGFLQFIFTVLQKPYTPSALFCCLILKSHELFFRFILCSHLLLGLILFDCDSQCFKSHKKSLSPQDISAWFSYSCTGDKHYFRGHGMLHLISSSQSGKNGFAAGPASCLSTHKGILDNSGIWDSSRHPCVGNWVELLISSLSAVKMN